MIRAWVGVCRTIRNMNMNKPNIQTTTKLLKLRGILDQVGQASWGFSVLNKQYPINYLTDDQAKDLIIAYEELVKKVKSSLKSEYENNGLGEHTPETA